MDEGDYQPHQFITDKTGNCISHIQGISLLGGDGRVTPLHSSLKSLNSPFKRSGGKWWEN